MLLWAHLHGNEAFNLVSSRDDDRGEGGGGGSDSDSDEATPNVLMLKVNLPAGRKQQGPRCRPPPPKRLIGTGWPGREAA